MALCKRDGKSDKKLTENKYLRMQMEKMESSTRRLIDLTERTHYRISQVNGQRTYGPPPLWNGDPPCKDCEIFVGRIPRDCFEDELIPVLEMAGFIYEFRLMMDFSGSNRGFGFALYSKPSEAQNAIIVLNQYEIRRGCTLGIVKSMNNCNLFVGGLEMDVTEEEIMDTLNSLTEGVSRVTFHLYKLNHPPQRQKKYALVEYESHRAAAMARRVLVPQKMRFRGAKVVVDWANPFGEDQKADKFTYSAVPAKSKEKHVHFDFKNKVVNNEEKLAFNKRASLAPRHARTAQTKQLNHEPERECAKQETFVNASAEIYQNTQIPFALQAGVPLVLQTKSPTQNPINGNCFSMINPPLSKNFNNFVLIPQTVAPAANLALQQVIFTAYQAQMFGFYQQTRPFQQSNAMKEPLVLGNTIYRQNSEISFNQ